VGRHPTSAAPSGREGNPSRRLPRWQQPASPWSAVATDWSGLEGWNTGCLGYWAENRAVLPLVGLYGPVGWHRASDWSRRVSVCRRSTCGSSGWRDRLAATRRPPGTCAALAMLDRTALPRRVMLSDMSAPRPLPAKADTRAIVSCASRRLLEAHLAVRLGRPPSELSAGPHFRIGTYQVPSPEDLKYTLRNLQKTRTVPGCLT
jgi:hypothetical protein